MRMSRTGERTLINIRCDSCGFESESIDADRHPNDICNLNSCWEHKVIASDERDAFAYRFEVDFCFRCVEKLENKQRLTLNFPGSIVGSFKEPDEPTRFARDRT